MSRSPDPADLLGKVMTHVPHMKALGLILEEIGQGRAVARVDYREDLVGFRETGVLAGGVIFTLMDSVSGAAVFSALKQLQPIATLDLRIDYLKPAEPGRSVIGQADCIKLTHHIGFVRGLAHHGDTDDPIALTSGTFALKHPKPKSEGADG